MSGLNSIFTPLQNLPLEAQLAGMAVIGGWKVFNFLQNRQANEAARDDYMRQFSELMKTNQHAAGQTAPAGAEWREVIPVSLFTRTDYAYGIDEIAFDMILDEEHSKAAKVTEYAVEDGSPISDHIELQPRELRFTALVSNFSITAQAVSPGYNRAAETWTALKLLMDDKRLVTITTVLERYPNMAITSVSAPRDGKAGDAVEFTVTAREVRVVKLRATTITGIVRPRTDAEKQASTKADGGRKTAEQAKKEEVWVMDQRGIIIREDTDKALNNTPSSVKVGNPW